MDRAGSSGSADSQGGYDSRKIATGTSAETASSDSQPLQQPDQKPKSQQQKHGQRRKQQQKQQQDKQGTNDAKAPSKLKALVGKLGLDVPTVILMSKAAIPPIICIAAYQADAWATTYGTVGYLAAIMAILGTAIMPRAKFMQTMFVNVFMVCFAAALNLLALWSAIQARKHYGPPVGYSSSQSAICAVWLFFEIYAINTIKSARPQYQIPVIIASIFCVISMTNGPNFPTMDSAITFMVSLIAAFLTGFAIATGVSFVIFPMTSRMIMFKMFTGYMGAMGKVLEAQSAYMKKMEEIESLEKPKVQDPDAKPSGRLAAGADPTDRVTLPKTPEEAALKGAIGGLIELHAKLRGELEFAKREAAYGKFNSKDIEELYDHLKAVMPPLIGMESVVDLVRRIAEVECWKDDDRERAFQDWRSILNVLHEPFETVTAGIREGLQHAMIRLEFIKPPKKNAAKNSQSLGPDVEEKGDKVSPGEPGFAAYFEAKTEEFYRSREMSLRAWCEEKGLDISHEEIQNAWQPHERLFDEGNHHLYVQRQLFLVLYMEYLLYRCYKAVDNIVKFADKKVEDGTMKRKRLITPTLHVAKEWILSLHKHEHDQNNGDHRMMNDFGSTQTSVELGDAFHERRDPEHLPPQTFLQRVGDTIRVVPHALRSEHSVFGIRVAFATMSIAIVAYLKDSAHFFTQQRLVWALIMVSFSMTRTVGQSTFGFLARIVGTLIAMIASYVIWYIVDQKTAGVIVFLYLWLTVCFYGLIKFPKYAPVAIICAVTAVLIIGYELQVRKVGIAASERTGQPAYPLYKFAPYRLATVVGGLACAYFWTVFPYPITESYALRQDIGKCLYLCANFNSIMHESVTANFRGDGGSMHDADSPATKLEKARAAVFTKTLTLIRSLKTSAAFSKFEVTVGGRFPAHIYDSIITRLERILTYAALVMYASRSFSDPYDQAATEEQATINRSSAEQWLHDLRHLLHSINPTTHDVTSVLCLLSSSVTNGLPLPPYMRLPKAYRLTQKMEAIDRDILDVRHIAEPAYSAFAVMQVASRVVVADVVALVDEVKELVGELDFSYHAVSTADGSIDSGSDLSVDRAKGKRE